MTLEEHRARHLELHRALDELAADYFSQVSGSLPSTTTLMDLMKWSFGQATSPTFRCPECGKVSHNPNDAAQQYCGACHAFVDDDPVRSETLFSQRGVPVGARLLEDAPMVARTKRRWRLIWTSDPANTYRDEFSDEVVGIISGSFRGFADVPPDLEREMLALLLKYFIEPRSAVHNKV